jgi:hypothetical protein
MNSTLLIDLLPAPERLETVFKEFIERLEKKLESDEKELDKCYETHRLRLHKMHEKTISSYKVIFEKMLKKLNQQSDIALVNFFEMALRTKRPALYSEVIEKILPGLESLEKHGGSIEIEPKVYDVKGISSGGCIFSEDPKGYFSFLGDFFDDENISFRVIRQWDAATPAASKEKGSIKCENRGDFADTVRADCEKLLANIDGEPFYY